MLWPQNSQRVYRSWMYCFMTMFVEIWFHVICNIIKHWLLLHFSDRNSIHTEVATSPCRNVIQVCQDFHRIENLARVSKVIKLEHSKSHLNLVSSYTFIFGEMCSDIFFFPWHIDGRPSVSGGCYVHRPSSEHFPSMYYCSIPGPQRTQASQLTMLLVSKMSCNDHYTWRLPRVHCKSWERMKTQSKKVNRSCRRGLVEVN